MIKDTVHIKKPSKKLLKWVRELSKRQRLISQYLKGEISYEILEKEGIKFVDVLKEYKK